MASRQPPGRSWFRFASMSRPVQTPRRQAQAQATRAAKPSPPAFTQSFSDAPIQPAVPTQAPTPSPVVATPPRAAAPSPAPAPKSPRPQAAAVPPSSLPVAPPKSPTSRTFPNAISLEPRVIREELKSTVPLSLSHKPASPPPAPVSQEIIRVAPVTTAKTIPKPDPSMSPKMKPSNGQKHSTEISHLNRKPDVRKDNGNYKELLYDSEEFGKLHKNSSNPRTWSDGDKYGIDSGSGNEKGRGKSKDKTYKAMPNSSLPMRAFMNSNVQAVNNSILYNCSYRHHDPGVHFSLLEGHWSRQRNQPQQ